MSKNYFPIIQQEAYRLWEQAGKPEGKSDFFWHLAKERVKAWKRERELREEIDYERRRGFLARIMSH